MAGMRPGFGQTGYSVQNNRVTLPTFSHIEQTYEKLPDGYNTGLIAEIEGLSVKAVLCKNGSTAIAKWTVAESNIRFIEEANLATDVPQRSKTVSIVTNLTAAALPEDRLAGGWLWIVGGTGIKDSGAYRKLLIAGNEAGDGTGPIDITLAGGTPVALDNTTDVIVEESNYGNTKIGAATDAHKTVGITPIEIPANEYWWAVFEGDIPAFTTVGQGLLVIKGASGAPTTKTATKETIGRVKYKTTNTTMPDIITLFIQGIDVQKSQSVVNV